MPTDAQYSHRRQKGPPQDKREPLEQQGVTKKADQGQKRWEKHGLQEHKAWEEVLPVWQRLRWYRYTGAQQGGALFARWPDSDQWGSDVWTANVPDAIKELAMRVGLATPPASASQSEPEVPAHSTAAAPESTVAAPDTTTAVPDSTAAPAAPPRSKATQLQPGLSVTTPAQASNPEPAGLLPTSNITELQSTGPQTITTRGRDTGARDLAAASTCPGTSHEDTAAVSPNMAVLLAATAHPDAIPTEPVNQTHSIALSEDAQDTGMELEELTGFPRFLHQVHKATQEYIRHQNQECDAAVQRWQHEYMKAKRQLQASENECLGMKQQLKVRDQQLQEALSKQEQRFSQQQAELVHKHQEHIRELETNLAGSTADLQRQSEEAHRDSQRVDSLEAQLACKQSTVEGLHRQVAELQEHNKELQQDNSEKADFIQTFLNAAATHAKRPRLSETTSSQV